LEDGIDVDERKPGSDRPAGRPSILSDAHKDCLIKAIDNNPAMIIVEMMETLTNELMDLKVSKITVYAFATNKYNISFKRASFHPVERNTPKRIEERYEWVQSWSHSDIDFMSNCVFIDESAFHIVLDLEKENPLLSLLQK
jgi:hypothetical protein